MKESGVSEVVGAIMLIALAVAAMAIVSLFLLSGPLPSSIPSFSGTIMNRSTTIYISHGGGDALYKGQYKILVDGVDNTSDFAKSYTDPWSAGKVMNYTLGTMPRRVVMVYTGSGTGETVLLSADLTTTATATQPYPLVAWSSTPSFGNMSKVFQFTDSSVGIYINAYYWNFNDGNTSTSKSPSHQFPCTLAGDVCPYSIDHSATDSAGTPEAATTWLNRSSAVTVYKNASPTVTFTANKRSGAAPLAVTFTATGYGPIKVDSWYWDFGDGVTDTSQNPSHTYTSLGLFTVTLTATNSTLGQNITTKTNFITTPDWYSCNWLYRKTITIWKSKVSNGPHTNFPVLINFTSADLKPPNVQATGNDLLFTKDDGISQLPHEIESYTSGSGTLVAWVNVSSISKDANTTIFLYYGNSTVSSQQVKTNVWDSNYKTVWHMNEGGTGTRYDSTANKNNLTPTNYDNNEGTTGQIAGADSLATDDYLISTQYIDINSNDVRTITFWLKVNSAANGGYVSWGQAIKNKKFGAVAWNSPSRYMLWGWDTANDYDTGTAVDTGAWFYHAVINDGSYGRWYRNGIQLGSGFSHTYSTSNNQYVYVGRMVDNSTSYYMNGIIDEIRISKSVRSVDWITTEYNNQYDPSSFHYPGAQQAWTC